jgi:hypothetical protein
MFDDPLDPFTTPYMAPMPQQETQSRLEMLGDDLLGGLGYFGNVLDKTFGGRAVRGALGGNARELLSVLPMSDTLGITNFDDRVSGRQLLGLPESSGEEGFGWDDAKGIGLEIALDPSMWVGAAVPKLVAQGLNAGAKAGGRGIQAVSGINPYTFAQKKVVNEVDRIGGNLFDRSRGGAWQSANQATARGTYFPTLDAATDVARREYLDALTPVDELVKKGFDQKLTMRGAMQAGEGDLPGALSTLQKAGYGPIDAQKVIDAATGYQKRVSTSSQAMETQSGALSNIVEDIPKWKQKLMDDYGPALPAFGPRPAEYVPHRLTSELGGVNYGNNNRSMTAFSEFQSGREEAYKGLGGAVAINDLARQARPPIPMGPPPTQMEIADNVFKSLTDGLPAGWQSQPWAKELTDGAMKQSEDLANRLAFLPPNVAEQGMFHEDLFGNLFSRQMAAARTTASADTIVAGLHPSLGQVQKVVDLQKANVPYVSVNEFLSKEGLTDVAGQKIASSLGLPPIANKLKDQLKDYGVPVEVANDMLRIGQSISAPSTLRPIIDAFTDWSHNLKANLTYPFPSFNIRNVLSGFFNMFRDNALNPTALKEMTVLQRGGSISDDVAKKLFPGMSAPEATIALRNEMMAAKVSFARNNQAFDVAASDASSAFGGFLPGELPTVGGQAKSVAGLAKEWFGRNVPGKGNVNPLNSETFFWTKWGREGANAGEDFTRGSHYLAKRLQGSSAAEAKLATMKYQLDYSNMSEFEKNVMKRIFPFYSYSRRSLPPLLEDLAKNPAKMSAAFRISSSRPDEGFVPGYLGEGTALSLGKGASGDTRFVSALGLPQEDETIKMLGNLMTGDVTRAMQGAAGMVSPILKTPIEQASGTQLSTGRKLSDLKQNYAGKAITELGLDEPFPGLPQMVSQYAGGTPAARFLTTAGKITDTRKDVSDKLINLLTGVQLTDVDLERQALIEGRKALTSRLEQSPLAREWSEVYVPKEKLALMSPRELEDYRFYKGLEEQAKRESQQRKFRQMLNTFE